MSQTNYAKELLHNADEFIITDQFHIFGITKRKNVKDEYLKEKYGEISFSFDMLERIKQVVQGLYQDDVSQTEIRFLAPKENLPLVIICRHPYFYERDAHTDHPEDTVIILAPRMEKGSVVYPTIVKDGSEKV